jgi:hypothetical protein
MIETRTPPRRNFLVRFWRGEYSLAISFWVFGLGLYALGIAAILALTLLVYRGTFDPRTIAPAIFAMWLVTALLLVFQSVGVWRAAARSSRLWAGLARLSVVAGITLVGVRFNQVGGAQVEQAWRMAYEDDPDIAPFSLRLMRDGQELEITGGFKFGLTKQARALAAKAPDLETVHLASGGGRIGEAIALTRLIQERGLATYVGTTCLSACTIAFIAGRERILKTGARLGFHRAAFAGAESGAAMASLLLAAGIERAFVEKVAAQPASGMWYPGEGELKAAHVITATADSYRFAASGLGAQPGPAAFARELRGNVLYRAFEEIDPALFQRLVEEYRRRYEAGQSEGDIEEALGELVALPIRRHIAASDNDVLIDYARLMADQYAAIGARDARACFLRLTRGATPAEGALMGPELRERESALQVRALRSSFPRPSFLRTPVPQDLLQANYAVVFKQLAQRYSPEELALFGHAEKVAPAQYATYCRLATAIFRGIAALPPMRAGDTMSAIFTNMGAASGGK